MTEHQRQQRQEEEGEGGQHPQDAAHAESISDPETFWARQASHLYWHRKPDSVLRHTTKALPAASSTEKKDDDDEKTAAAAAAATHHPHWEWFSGGQISTCYNCVDRHVLAGNGDRPAIFWDSPVTGSKQAYTYKELLDEVEVTAGALREEGIKKGDVVLVYMPMIPQALIGILAISRLGAIHAVVFGGFGAESLAQRIEASRATAILTASCGIEGNKPPLSYAPFIRDAVDMSKHKPHSVFVWQRDQLRWDRIEPGRGEINWFKKVRSCRARDVRAEAVPVDANEGLYIIYTSGTTGTPKGVVRDAGGHAVGLDLSIRAKFDVHGPGDVMFCASDIGWVVGHSYILYAPLLAGAATVLLEGKPIGTPDSSTFFRIVDEYKVTTLFTAPTALRAIKRDDPDNSKLRHFGEKGGLRSLRALFLAGERSEPSIVTMYQELLDQYASPGAMVVDNWWSSESGSPISGISLAAHAAHSREQRSGAASGDLDGKPAGEQKKKKKKRKPLAIKPGSAGKAAPGFDVRVVDDQGNELKRGKMGNIVMALPLAPTGFRSLWDDEERFYNSYLKRFDGKWMDTGDTGMMDQDGYISIMSRSDDLINTAGHRLSTGSIEQAITSHPSVAEACVVPIPDSLKGQLPFAFITLSISGGDGEHPTGAIPDAELAQAIQQRVRKQIGGIAALGGIVQGRGMIPKTRSGKTLRRVLRELVENAVHGEFDKEVVVPATVEDKAVVDVARAQVREYFRQVGGKHAAIEVRAKL